MWPKGGHGTFQWIGAGSLAAGLAAARIASQGRYFRPMLRGPEPMGRSFSAAPPSAAKSGRASPPNSAQTRAQRPYPQPKRNVPGQLHEQTSSLILLTNPSRPRRRPLAHRNTCLASEERRAAALQSGIPSQSQYVEVCASGRLRGRDEMFDLSSQSQNVLHPIALRNVLALRRNCPYCAIVRRSHPHHPGPHPFKSGAGLGSGTVALAAGIT